MTKAELYKKACMLPLLPGVYIIRDKSGTIIYIGKAKRLRIRVSQYFREGVPHDNKVSQMIAHAYAFDVIVCQSEFEALVLEASQIKAHTPKYNILLKDDKGYSYIKVTKDEWPRLSFTLQKRTTARSISALYLELCGPSDGRDGDGCFLLPRCSRRFPQEIGRGRPCLNAHIGKCMAVCSGKISRENYEQAVKSAVHLIRYGKKDILKTLNERMLEASDRLEFETAALIRDQIAAITKVTAGQKVVVDPDVEMDVVALAGTPGSVCAAVLRFREGRLTDKREFLFHDTADIAAVRRNFCPGTTSTMSRYRRSSPWTSCRRMWTPCSRPSTRSGAVRCSSMSLSGAIRRTSSRWPTPTPSSGWPARAAGTPGRKSFWMSWRRCWACPSPPHHREL